MCSTAERVILDVPIRRPAKGAVQSWNVTIHVPLVDLSHHTTLQLAHRLRGMSAPARADDVLLTLDSRVKTADGSLASCQRAAVQISEDHLRPPAASWRAAMLSLSWGLRVRALPYEIVGSTARALSRAFNLKGETPQQFGAKMTARALSSAFNLKGETPQ